MNEGVTSRLLRDMERVNQEDKKLSDMSRVAISS